MIEVDGRDIEGMMDKDWSIRKKIEWILMNHYPRGRKILLTEAVDLILEETQEHFEIENRKKWANGQFLKGIDFTKSGKENPIVKVLIFTDRIEMTRYNGQKLTWEWNNPTTLSFEGGKKGFKLSEIMKPKKKVKNDRT